MKPPAAIETAQLHPDFPEKVWVVIEQPPCEPYRFSYDPDLNTFSRTPHLSLLHARGFSGAYGWIAGSGTPPEPHLDILLLTKEKPQAGDVILGYVCGVFFRGDGDHKFVAMDAAWRETVPYPDLSTLDAATYNQLTGIYPQVGVNEGWDGAAEAYAYLKSHIKGT
jgi:hypothetical protein